jgi:CENP-S associating Centromere protein X
MKFNNYKSNKNNNSIFNRSINNQDATRDGGTVNENAVSSSAATTDTTSSGTIGFKPSLVRQLLQPKNSSRRLTPEALLASSELLRLFVIEARDRAGLEAECDNEATMTSTTTTTAASAVGATYNTKNKRQDDDDDDDDDEIDSNRRKRGKPIIRADHVTKIGAELLFDFT